MCGIKEINMGGRKPLELTGKQINKLYIVKQVERPENNKRTGRFWLCQCDCGKEIILNSSALNGRISCGCQQKEANIKNGKNFKKDTIYDLSGDFGIGYTQKGEEFYFDLSDFDLISGYCWHFDNYGYLLAYDIKNPGNRKKVRFHRLVMNPRKENVIDHIGGESSRNDNRKSNLRECSQQENICNQAIKTNNTSGVTGVWYDKRRNAWIAEIKYNYKKIHIGQFIDKIDAIYARKEKEKELFGEFAYREAGGEKISEQITA